VPAGTSPAGWPGPDPIRNREAPGPGRACPFGGKAWHGTEPLSVVFFQDSGKFTYRYSTLGFQDEANLDDGDMWPVSYVLMKWSPVVEKKIVELVKAAIP
jgi:hypothetical protein